MIPRTFREEMILWSFRVLPHVQENLVRSGWIASLSVVEPVPHMIKTVAQTLRCTQSLPPRLLVQVILGVCLTVAWLSSDALNINTLMTFVLKQKQRRGLRHKQDSRTLPLSLSGIVRCKKDR